MNSLFFATGSNSSRLKLGLRLMGLMEWPKEAIVPHFLKPIPTDFPNYPHFYCKKAKRLCLKCPLELLEGSQMNPNGQGEQDTLKCLKHGFQRQWRIQESNGSLLKDIFSLYE